MRIRPVLLGVQEHEIERVGSDPFGASGTAWASVFGITVGDANRTSRSRAWSPGMGGWRPPRWTKHPVPLGLDVYLVVRSPRYGGVIDGFDPTHMSRATVLNKFDRGAIVADVRAFFAELSECDWDRLVEVLSARFVVEDT